MIRPSLRLPAAAVAACLLLPALHGDEPVAAATAPASPALGPGPAPAASTAPGMAARTYDDASAARVVFEAALAEARKRGAGGAITVVDAGGHLVFAERLAGTFPNAARISMGKARTAALFQRPTKVFEDLVNGGRVSMTALEDFTPLQGGHPFRVAGRVAGAVGVSGAASAAADEEIAVAALQGLEAAAGACCTAPAPAAARRIEGSEVARAFARGAPLIEVPEYKVHASRREAAGQAEIHERDTDIIYVLDGTATLVTGGKVSGAAPLDGSGEELRGPSIEGGETRTISAGDVIVVPAGVPHWFQKVPSPITYYVVKVTAACGRCS